MGSYTNGKWQSLPEKLASTKRKNENPRRGGKRATPAQMETESFRQEIARQVGGEKQISAKAKTTSKVASAPKAKPASKAGPTEKFARKPIAKTGSTTVSDVQNKMEAPKKSAIKPAKRDIKLGVIGRTGGKCHLGKKVGKG